MKYRTIILFFLGFFILALFFFLGIVFLTPKSDCLGPDGMLHPKSLQGYRCGYLYSTQIKDLDFYSGVLKSSFSFLNKDYLVLQIKNGSLLFEIMPESSFTDINGTSTYTRLNQKLSISKLTGKYVFLSVPRGIEGSFLMNAYNDVLKTSLLPQERRNAEEMLRYFKKCDFILNKYQQNNLLSPLELNCVPKVKGIEELPNP